MQRGFGFQGYGFNRPRPPGGFNPLADLSNQLTAIPGALLFAPWQRDTLKQDTAGTLLIPDDDTAYGKSVGMILSVERWGGKSLAQVVAGQPELRGNGVVRLSGSAPVATYNAASGVGSVSRVNGSNQSDVKWTLPNGGCYRIEVTNTGAAPLGLKDGGLNNITVLGAGQTATFHLISASTGLSIAAGADNVTVPFLIHSFKEIPSVPATRVGTDAARPTFARMPKTGVRNLLTYTEDFSPGAWTKDGTGTGSTAVVTANAGTAPDGSMTAARVQFNRGGGTTVSDASRLFQFLGGTDTRVGSIYIKSNDASSYSLQLLTGSNVQNITAGASWTRVTVSGASASNLMLRLVGSVGASSTADILIWHPQLESGSTATAYQKVTGPWDVTEAGVPSIDYLRPDGQDDYMVTPAIDLTAYDKIAVVAGVRKRSDAANGMMAEFSANLSSNNGTFMFLAPGGAGLANYYFGSKGTTDRGGTYTNASVAAPHTAVLTGLGDISGDLATLFVNGVQRGQSNLDQGSGNYGNHQLFLFGRNGSNLPASVDFFGLALIPNQTVANMALAEQARALFLTKMPQVSV